MCQGFQDNGYGCLRPEISLLKKRLYYNQSQCINQLGLHQERQEMDICLLFFFFFQSKTNQRFFLGAHIFKNCISNI